MADIKKYTATLDKKTKEELGLRIKIAAEILFRFVENNNIVQILMCLPYDFTILDTMLLYADKNIVDEFINHINILRPNFYTQKYSNTKPVLEYSKLSIRDASLYLDIMKFYTYFVECASVMLNMDYTYDNFVKLKKYKNTVTQSYRVLNCRLDIKTRKEYEKLISDINSQIGCTKNLYDLHCAKYYKYIFAEVMKEITITLY